MIFLPATVSLKSSSFVDAGSMARSFSAVCDTPTSSVFSKTSGRTYVNAAFLTNRGPSLRRSSLWDTCGVGYCESAGNFWVKLLLLGSSRMLNCFEVPLVLELRWLAICATRLRNAWGLFRTAAIIKEKNGELMKMGVRCLEVVHNNYKCNCHYCRNRSHRLGISSSIDLTSLHIRGVI